LPARTRRKASGGNPVGTIFVARPAPQRVWSKKLSYPGPRSAVKVRTVNTALDWLRRDLVRAATGVSTLLRHTTAMRLSGRTRCTGGTFGF
jgi:nicotinamide-nucleotide amidase